MIITDDKLIELGFKRYNTAACSKDAKKYLFQKRYLNNKGDILYFLDIYKWDWTIYPWANVPEPYTYEISTQLYTKGDHEAVNLSFGTYMTIEDAEKFINTLFDVGLVEPYELAE